MYRYLLDFVTLRCADMLPVHQHSCIRQYQCYVHRCVLDPDALVRTASKYEVVLRVCVGGTLWVQPSFWNESVGIGKDFGIVQGVVERGNNHATDRDSVIVGDRESFGGFVRHLRGENLNEMWNKDQTQLVSHTIVTGGFTLIDSLTNAFKYGI